MNQGHEMVQAQPLEFYSLGNSLMWVENIQNFNKWIFIN